MSRNWRKLLPRLSPFLLTYAFPFLEIIAVFVYRKKLDEKFYKDKFGAIWKDTNYKKHWTNALFKPF